MATRTINIQIRTELVVRESDGATLLLVECWANNRLRDVRVVERD